MSVIYLLSVAFIQTAVDKPIPPSQADDARMVCKTRPSTGSRVGNKICHTKAQWEAMAEQNMRDAKDMIDRPSFEARRE